MPTVRTEDFGPNERLENTSTEDIGYHNQGEPYVEPRKSNSIDLDQEHPEFTKRKGSYHKCCQYVRGGDSIENKPQYLKQHPYESKKQYEIRLWLSKYRNHARPIVNVFHSAVWENQPDRSKLDSIFNNYLEDVDRQGASVDEFFSDVSRNAATAGIHFVLVDHTELPDINTPKTKKEADRYNLRPFFRHIKAEQFIDWGFEKDEMSGAEMLSYAVIREEVEVSSIPFRGREMQTQYTLWTKNKWEVWVHEEKKARMILSGNHGCGVVPIIPCAFESEKPMTGMSSVYDIVGLCEKIYRNGSSLSKSLYDTAYPLQLFIGFTNEQLKNFIGASSSGLIGEIGSDSKYIEPTGRSFEELRKEIQSDENAIKEIALRMIRPESKVAESAESKRLDQEQLNSKLIEFASNVEECESKCWKVFGVWLGFDDPAVEIEYAKSFDNDAISVELISLFRDLSIDGILPNDDVIDLLIRSGFLPDNYDRVEAKQKLKDDLRIDPNYPLDKREPEKDEPETKEQI